MNSRLRRRLFRLRRALRPYRSTLALVLGVFLLSIVWVAVRGALAARELQAVQRDITSLQAASSDPRSAELDVLMGSLQQHAGKADRYSHDVVWKAWARAPLLGAPMTVLSGVADATDSLSRSAVPPLVDAAKVVRGLRRDDGSFDAGPLVRNAAALEQAARTLAAATKEVRGLPSTRVSAIDDGRRKFVAKLHELSTRARSLAAGAQAAPELLGTNGERRYLIAVQNLAEGRASGGIIGAYGLLTVSRGKPTLEAFGSDSDLTQVSRNAVDLGPEWRQRYDALGQARDWREVTTTPDFPTAAKAMLALWRVTHSGQRLDGVLSVDPVALADVLEATGPVQVAGGTLRAASFVQATLADAYRDFPNKADRSRVLSSNARAVFSALVKGAGAPLVLGERLGNAVISGHLKLFSANPATQAQLTRTPISGALPLDQPLLGIVTQDGNNDKLFYYLRRSMSYDVLPGPAYLDFGDGKGPQRQEQGHLLVTLTNAAPSNGLPDYVAPGINLASGAAIPPGRMRISLSVYLGSYGVLEDATLDGHAVPAQSQTEQGLSVLTFALDLDPGATSRVEMTFRQPAPLGAPLRVISQPVAVTDGPLVTNREVSTSSALN